MHACKHIDDDCFNEFITVCSLFVCWFVCFSRVQSVSKFLYYHIASTTHLPTHKRNILSHEEVNTAHPLGATFNDETL